MVMAVAPRAVRLDRFVDGHNCLVPIAALQHLYPRARIGSDESPAAWLLEQFKK